MQNAHSNVSLLLIFFSPKVYLETLLLQLAIVFFLMDASLDAGHSGAREGGKKGSRLGLRRQLGCRRVRALMGLMAPCSDAAHKKLSDSSIVQLYIYIKHIVCLLCCFPLAWPASLDSVAYNHLKYVLCTVPVAKHLRGTLTS